MTDSIHDSYVPDSAARVAASARPYRNTSLIPLASADRLFGWRDHASLWFSLGVGLLVMQVGAYLVPAMGTRGALLAIVAGSILGAGLLAWTAKIGCDSGLSSAGLMHAAYGSRFAHLPVFLNVIQLIGWTTFEMVIMRDGTVAIAREAGWLQAAFWPTVITLAWGVLFIALLSGSMVRLVRRFVGRYLLPLVVLSLLWLSWQFGARAHEIGWSVLWERPGDGGMSTLAALDLVIAMPISWLPLVADFARHGRSGRSALRGTWLGYAIANIWCYGLGVLVALTVPSVDLVAALLLAQGGLIALALILVDEVDNAYGDLYSGSVASHSLLPRIGQRSWALLLAIGCTLFALVLPMRSLEPFLLMLSSVFVPLYGVILGRLGGRTDVAARIGSVGVHHGAALIWLAGIALFHLSGRFTPEFGSALPTLALTWLLARMSRADPGPVPARAV